MAKIGEAQWVITYKCGFNQSTNYCSLGTHALPREATFKRKLEAVQTLATIGIKTLKILGGEFFDLKEAEQIMRALNAADLQTVITTNGMHGRKIMRLVKECEINCGLFFSVDFLDPQFSIGGCSQAKTLAALKLIPRLAALPSPPLLGVNTVVHARNLGELPKILKWITEWGGYLNICPLIWGAWDEFIYRTESKTYALLPAHRAQVQKTMDTLLEMKEKGYHLACTQDYVSRLAAICCLNDRFGWDCGQLNFCPLLRIDADLSLMVCSDLRGAQVPHFKLDDLKDPATYTAFQAAWLADEKRLHCIRDHGCYWSNIVRSVDNFSQGGSFTE